ncbi:hypothetical protein L7F22_054203 [Adiantum nelumboides]|nr:hypothetical protein [Adiantum nelumboides]
MGSSSVRGNQQLPLDRLSCNSNHLSKHQDWDTTGQVWHSRPPSSTSNCSTATFSNKGGHDGIWTIIDRFSKQAHFVPVKKTVKPDHLARLFVAQILRLHGMPETIISDRDPRFTSLFWKAIWENIGISLQFLSSFHPQTDGQSDIADSMVLDLLTSYISDQKTQWERYLPLVEFAYNNMIHSSMGKAPFEIVQGAMKVPPFLSTKDKILEANEYTRDLDTAFAKVRETLQKSQERQKKAANRH